MNDNLAKAPVVVFPSEIVQQLAFFLYGEYGTVGVGGETFLACNDVTDLAKAIQEFYDSLPAASSHA